MPRGLIAAMMILLVFAALMLLLTPGGGGADAIKDSDNPLPLAIDEAKGEGTFVGDFVNTVGLVGLIASFFSIIFAYSRQLFALSRAGYLPRGLSVTSGRKVPTIALIVPGDRSASCSPRSPRTGRRCSTSRSSARRSPTC